MINSSMIVEIKNVNCFWSHLDEPHPQKNGGKDRFQTSLVLTKDHPQLWEINDAFRQAAESKFGVYDMRNTRVPHVGNKWNGSYKNKFPDLFVGDYLMFHARSSLQNRLLVLLPTGVEATKGQIQAYQDYPHKIDIKLGLKPYGAFTPSSTPGVAAEILEVTLADCPADEFPEATDGSRAIPPVTAILRKTASQLEMEWYKHERAKWSSQQTEIGKIAHEMLQHSLKDDKIVDKPKTHWDKIAYQYYSQILIGMAQRTSSPQAIEIKLSFDKKYTGRIDLVALHDGEMAVIDYKTTGIMKSSEDLENYKLQLCAYADLWDKAYPDKPIRRGVIAMATDTEFCEFILGGDEFDKYRGKWRNKLKLFWDGDPDYAGEII